MEILASWAIFTLAIAVSAYLLPGVHVSGFFAAFASAVVLGLVNAFLRPLLVLLTLPINVLTLGLFTLVINAVLILLTTAIVPGFQVDGFLWAVGFSLLLAIIHSALVNLVGKK